MHMSSFLPRIHLEEEGAWTAISWREKGMEEEEEGVYVTSHYSKL